MESSFSSQEALHYECLPDLILEEVKEIGAFLIDLNRRITSWSPGVEHILGYPKEDFIGMAARDLFTPEDRAQKADDSEFRTALTHGRSSEMRWHMRRDGSRAFVDGVLIAMRDDVGKCIGYTRILRDVRPDRMSDGMLRAILDRTPDVIYVKDRDGRYAFANSQTARMLGRSIEAIVGHTSDEFLPADISRELAAMETAIMLDNNPRVVEERMVSGDGSERVFLSGKAPWQDATGRTIGVVTIAQDISDRKAGEEERRRLMQELQRSNDDLAQFASVVSHDLQTPLRAVTTYAQLLEQRYGEKLDETANRCISMIVNGAASMQQLIESLLHYAYAGEEILTPGPVSVASLVERVLSTLRPLIEEKNAEIICGPLPAIFGDSTRFLQLFQNLIGNALKYSKPGVRPRVGITAENTGPAELHFEVSDNGIGIAPKDFELIFAPLKRLHGHEIPGTGIGLAVCRKIVERQGGRIWVTSEPDKGSVFHFTLPATPLGK